MSVTELPAEDREKWESFISGQLADTNKRNTVDLVSNNTDMKTSNTFWFAFMLNRLTAKVFRHSIKMFLM